MTTAAASAADAAPAPPASQGWPAPIHSGATVERYVTEHFRGAVFPMAAGLLLYGWRALVVMAVVMASAAGATLVLRQVGRRGRDLSVPHAVWLALLLSLALPAHLGTLRGLPWHGAAFWLLPAAGLVLGLVLWATRGAAGGALHPVVVTYLLLAAGFDAMLVPQQVLRPDRLFLGDVLDLPDPGPPGAPASSGGSGAAAGAWWLRRGTDAPADDARRARPASESLLRYTAGGEVPERGALLLQGMLRDRVPPLEDLVVAGNPGPIGASSVIFVIVGGLFLLYRGVIDARIPLLIVLVAFAALLVLPVPVSVTPNGPQWAWLAFRDPSVGWAVAITFANYELAASPVAFMACFLATYPPVRPITRRGRTVFAVVAGVLTAALQLYVSVSWGPYAALLCAGLFTPVADRWFQPRPLV
jgi:Na+-translocating ferredoxin:NAD+ oxidoreductase RnfD subunit